MRTKLFGVRGASLLEGDSVHTLHIGDVAGILQVELGLKAECVEAIEEELPGKDTVFLQDSGEEVKLVQDHRTVTDNGVKLELQAVAHTLEQGREKIVKLPTINCYLANCRTSWKNILKIVKTFVRYIKKKIIHDTIH